MAQHVEDVSEKVFGDCRAVIFILESDQWKELVNGGLAHVQLLRQNIQPNSTHYRVQGTSESTGQVVLNVVLDKDTKYEITQDISYHHLKTKTNVYSLKLSQDSNGMEFALVVQTIIRTIQENNPPSPKEAWMSPAARQQPPPVVQPPPLKDQLLSSPDAGKTFSLPPQKHHSTLSTSLSMSTTSIASSGRPAVSPRAHLHPVFEDPVELLCETLSDAISEGNVQKAIETTKLITEQGIQVTIRQKHPKTMLLDEGSELFNIKVVVEDRETSGGKFEMKVSSVTTISSLQQEVAARYGFPPKVQKWIIGKKLAQPTDTLAKLNIKTSGFTAFLYIVSSRNIGLTKQELENYKAFAENHRTGTSYMSTDIQAAALLSPRQAATIGTANQLSKAASLPSLNNPGQSSNTTFQTPRERTTFRRETQIENASQPSRRASSQVNPVIPMQRHENTNQATGGVTVSRVASQPGASPALITLATNQTIGDIERMLEAAGDSGLLFSQQMGISGHQESVVQPQGWSCLDCTFVNTPTRPGCELCGADRPADYVVPQNPHISEQERLRLQKEREETEIFQRTINQQQQEQEVAREMNFRQLVETAQQNLIRNTEEFDCAICFLTFGPGEGVMLRECLHCFCEDCLREHIKNCTDPEVQCPFQDNDFACHFVITAQEIKALLQEEDFNKFLNRSLATAESQASNSFHCKTANCPGWCIYEDNSNIFHCPVCQKVNCLTCKAIHHPDMNCKEYQEDLERRAQNDIAAKQTQKFLEQMIEKGDAMKCPQCAVILLKKDGCDWMRCTMCRLEICWATRGPRWGPMGVGDLSGGCKCRVGGKRCHPKCKNCH